MRIRAKRLRYTAEFFEPAYGKPARGWLNGSWRSRICWATSRTASSAASSSTKQSATAGAWPADTSLALGQMVQFEAQREKELRAAFPAAYRAVRESWQRLRKIR